MDKADRDTLNKLQAEVERQKLVLNTLIAWMAGSANSPISVEDARKLINEVGRP